MNLQTENTNQRYSNLSMALHWVMLLLLVAVYACIELREIYPKGSEPREALKTWHFMLGMSVFVLVWLRIIGRMLSPAPAINPPLQGWQQLAARVFHWFLYIFMIGMPLAGWLILSAEGKPVPFFGLELPVLVAENEAVADVMEEIHETVGVLGYFAIGIHALAGLWHHFVKRDNTLVRMLPKSVALNLERNSGERSREGNY